MQAPRVATPPGPVDPRRHNGRRALVTGAGSGIGQAVLIRMAAEGAAATGCDIDAEGLARTEKLLQDAGLRARLVSADLKRGSAVDEVVSAARFGGVGLDVLANVAGIADGFLPLAEMDDPTWDEVLAVDLVAVMRLCRAVVPQMCDSGGGAIVNVSSVAGICGGAGGTAYTVAKHGVIGLTRSIAYLYGPQKVRCNAVCPGGVSTGIWRTAKPRVPWVWDRVQASMARNRGFADPDDVAGLISWLGSTEATNVNGAVITSDGGWTAG